jgi:membrane-bound lytic murein transglycosylase D
MERTDSTLRASIRTLPVLVLVLFYAVPVAAEVLFPRPPSLQAQVIFWKQVYREYSIGDFVLHDRDKVGIVYEIVRVAEREDQARAARLAAPAVERLRIKYQGILTRLAEGQDPGELGSDGVRVAKIWGCPCVPETLLRAASNIRAQEGLRERVEDGVKQARLLLPKIVTILRKHRLPVELAAIPMVESSFNPKAQSKVAAVGLWQFMRTTGQQYLKITRRRDDRRDPLRATEGAARLLRDNYELLGSWPLAIVAYNHGAGGMRAARRSVGSGAIDEIIQRYAGPRFGFASKNFYPEFLAALDVIMPLLRKHAPGFELRHVKRGEEDAVEIRIPEGTAGAPLPEPSAPPPAVLPSMPHQPDVELDPPGEGVSPAVDELPSEIVPAARPVDPQEPSEGS